MKKSIRLAIAATMVLSGTGAFATNGDNLMGLDAQSRGMGGATIAVSTGAESGITNPANITAIAGTEVSFGGTLFMPNVEANMGAGYSKSAADMSMIPEVAIASNLGNGWYLGIGMWGTAGMGVDYRDATGYTSNMNMVTNLQLMQFGVPVAYKKGNLSVGVTPILQYGSLDINYDMTAMGGGNVGSGVAQDFGFGFLAGATYNLKNFTVGATYQSAINMDYSGQLSSATAPFVAQGVFPAPMGDNLEQPAEFGVGISYKMDKNLFAFDFKNVQWGSAKGYKDFNWQDQNIYKFGYQYSAEKWQGRLGYNYAKQPIEDAGAMTMQQAGMAAGGMPTPNYFGGNAINMFNLLGFPAIVESHYTAGASYFFSKMVSVDVAYVYAAPKTVSLLSMPNMQTGQDMTTSAKMSQNSISAQINFNF